MRKLWKDVRGISPLIATLMLIMATIVGGGIVFAAMRSQADILSPGADLEITRAEITVTPTSRVATVTVRNTGTVSFTSLTVAVTTESTSDVSITLSPIPLSSGQSASGENTAAPAGTWIAGRTYTVRVTGTAADNSTIIKSVSVRAK